MRQGRMTPGRARAIATISIGLALAGGACRGDGLIDLSETFDAEIVTPDTTMLVNEVGVFRAVATYTFGLGAPTQISWGISDTSKAFLVVRPDLTATVSPIDTGEVRVVAVINGAFTDSVTLTIVRAGFVRWRQNVAGAVTLNPAIGADSNIRAVHGTTLSTRTPSGELLQTTESCNGRLGPSVSIDNDAYVTGANCTRRHTADGVGVWAHQSGGLGLAVARDSGAVVLAGDTVIRLSKLGAVVWSDTLGGSARTAPVVHSNGDIYVAWSAGANADSVSQIAGDGTVNWTVGVPGVPDYASPAIVGGSVVFSHPGGLFAVDATGAITWERVFAADNAAATDSAPTSSPVLDGAGTIFVLTSDALYSYSATGQIIWYADSLGYGTPTTGVGAPTLLSNGTVLVPCQSPTAPAVREVCNVEGEDGGLVWRSAFGSGTVEGVVVGREGTVIAMRTRAGGGGEIAGVWSRLRLEPLGWPTEGGSERRTRRK